MLLFLIVLASPFVISNIYINEFESNPNGTDSGNEWIELYNNGTSSVDISGWTVEDTGGLIHTIPSLTSISGNNFYVLTLSIQTLTNAGETITLKNSTGFQIDQTPSLADTGDNITTWQRISDGVGTFQFRNETKGVTNNGGIINVPGDYGTIQEAINNANKGDTIILGSETFIENLIIDRGVEILGNGTTSTTIIEGTHTISSSNVKLTEIIFKLTASGTAITLDNSISAIDDVNISKNIFNITISPSVGVHLGTGVNKISNIVMEDNIFNGPLNMVCNPWKIGGSFGAPISSEVEDVDFQRNSINYCSTPINLHDKNIRDILINDNIFRNTDGAMYIWGEGAPSGVLSQFVFTNNDLDSTNSYGLAFFGFDGGIVSSVLNDSHFGTGNKVNNNKFIGIPGAYGLEAVSVLGTFTSYELDATNNYWGACDGPSGVGTGSGSGVSSNVDFDPWVGVCFESKISPFCAYEAENSTISVNLVSNSTIDNVIFTLNISGVMGNHTFNGINNGTNYTYEINSSELIGGENITWNVYVIDEFGNTFLNSWKEFYVRNQTYLTVNPLIPDGLNGWYITEPIFSLFDDPNGTNIFYQWDNDDVFLYPGPFNLDNITNAPPKISAGILDLNWWSNFGVCGNETKQTQILYVDLTNPLITNLSPSDGSTVYNNPRPEVSALLDEIYQSNSGINLSSVTMELNGVLVNANVTNNSDATVRFTPTTNLTEGVNNVTVNVTDNAGRFSSMSWSFTINQTVGLMMNVSSPESKVYDIRRIPFNITLNRKVELLEYINYNDIKPRWKRLCKDCDEFGFSKKRTKTARVGENNISIRAIGGFGQTIEENISLFVDARKPKISKAEPRRNSVTNGSDFYLKYTEDNLVDVLLSWNPTLNLNSFCNESGKNKECFFNVDLTGFENQEIEYYFNITDISGNSDSSRITKVLVDTLDPELNSFNYSMIGRRIEFEFNITEINFDEINYIDLEENKPRERRLCTRLDNDGICEKRKTFRKGFHNLVINVLDDAGNSVITNVNFTIS
jgi:hypothetical protein